MSIEGGQFRCYATGYETASIKKWNEHATEDCDKHTESGVTKCISCGEEIEYQHIPFKPLAADGSKTIQLQCDECMDAQKGNVKRSKSGAKK